MATIGGNLYKLIYTHIKACVDTRKIILVPEASQILLVINIQFKEYWFWLHADKRSMRKAKEEKLKGNLKTTGYPLMMILFLKSVSKNLFSFVHNNRKSWTGYPSVMTITLRLSHQDIFSGCPHHLTGEIIKLNVVTILKF